MARICACSLLIAAYQLALALGSGGCRDAAPGSATGVGPAAGSGAGITTAVRRAASATPPASSARVDADALALIIEAHDASWLIAPSGGADAVHIEVRHERVLIRHGDTRIDGELRGGSRRYRIAGEPGYLVKVKRRGPRIWLRDSDGHTRCDAHVSGSTVRVELPGREPVRYLIVARGQQSYSVSRAGQLQGTVERDEASGSTLVRDAAGALRFEGQPASRSASWAALLLDDLPEPLRYVLMAEIGARGR